ncbi:MAG: hypothetical protein WBP08_06850 [Saprospiraceae bacterium]|jgi:photosystem II stability/assembly factor-like uncharacterized protein
MKHFYITLFSILFTVTLFSQKPIPLKSDEIFGAVRARQIGPAVMSGRVIDLEAHPTNSKVFYVAAAGGGVWQTNNGGVTFNPIFDKYTQCIGTVELDPNDPDKTIWVGTGETWTRNSVSIGNGVYKTTDGGQNWEHMGLPNSERISNIIVNPKNSNEVLVGVLGALWGDSAERGIYKTTDGGKTWKNIFYINSSTGCSELIMDPSNPDILYAAFWEFRRTAFSFNSGGLNSALYKSTDGGRSWNKIHNGFPSGKLGRITVAVAPSNSSILYSAIEAEKPEDKGLYKSEDAGLNWKKLNGDFELVVRPFYFSRLVIDPKNPDIILKAGLSGYISKDGGKTFRSIDGGVHSDFHDYIFDPNDSNKIIVGTDGGVYRSYDGGSVWEMVKGLPLSQYYHVSVDNRKPYWVYGGLQDNGSWVGPSKKVGGIKNSDWISVGYGDGFRVYPHPSDPNTVYSEMQGAENIWRVDVAKSQAKTIKPYPIDGDPKLRFNWNAALSTSVHNPDRLYVGSQFVHVSEDKGETWRKLSPDLTTNDPKKQLQEDSGGLSADNSGAENHCTVFTINESPLDKDIIWVGTDDGNIQVTMDGGKSWNNMTANLAGVPKNTWTYFIEPSNFDKNTAYAVFDGHTQNDMKAYVMKTTDAGKTWNSIVGSQIPVFARCIKEDPKNPNLLYLGTEWGLYVTVDGGQNWAKFENNMPAVAVHYMAIQRDENALVMATHGRGIIIIDDVTPLREITEEALDKELEFITVKPTVINESSMFQSFPAVGEYVGNNPTTSARIVYFMNKRHTFGKMTMAVYDMEGKKIADLNPGKSKGINEVQWNYTLAPPKTAKGKSFTFGAFAGLTVPAGDYTVKLTKGNKEYTQTIALKYDENSIHSDEDRKIRDEKGMELYNMMESLAYEVDKLDMLQKTAEEIIPLIKDKKLAKQLNLPAYIKEIEDLRKVLVVTTGDNYVGTAEPQLREKIATLYGEVAGYAGKPSGAQIGNLALLSSKLTEAKAKVEMSVKKSETLNKQLEKAKINKQIIARENTGA